MSDKIADRGLAAFFLAVTIFGAAAGTLAQTPSLFKAPRKAQEKIAPGMSETWVKTGFFNEIDRTQKSAATINEPGVLRFLWGTKISGAQEGMWRLRRRSKDGSFLLLATGFATNGAGGRFDVDLAPYLPSAPSVEPTSYHLEVVARAKSKVDTTSATSVGGVGAKTAARELGHWSFPVVITYAVNPAPQTRFDLDEVYRKATLVLDAIRVVEDQDGPGREEYRVAGFVQELQRACAGGAGEECPFTVPLAQRRFDPIRRDLNPPAEAPLSWTFDPSANPPLHPVDHNLSFTLGTAGSRLAGPRRFAAIISLIEEDAGGSMAEWSAGVGELAEAVNESGVLDMGKQEIEDYLLEHAGDAIRYVADGVHLISVIADLGAATPVVGTAVAVAAFIIVPIVQDMADDYYGTGGEYLTIHSNRLRDVHSLPGMVVGSGVSQKYVLRTQTLQFKGPPASNAAAGFDGKVEIDSHWEFSQREAE